MNEDKGISFYVAGVRFHKLDKVISFIKPGHKVRMLPEPTNKYDPNAIRLEYSHTMIGYVPKRLSSKIMAMIEVGKDLSMEVSEVNKDAPPWERLKVTISERSSGKEKAQE